MRNSNEQSIAEIIKKLMNTYNLNDGVNTVSVGVIWNQLMGIAIQNRTSSVNLKNKILTVKVDSAVLRQELMFKKEEIKQAINEELKAELVFEVHIK